MDRVGHSQVEREPLAYIVRHLRPRDRQEIFALRWDNDEDRFVEEILACAGDLWKLWYFDDEPVAATGMVPVRPGVVIGGAFGTDKWRKAVRPITRWARGFIIPSLQNANYHRIEAYVLAENTDSRRWIERFGGEVEALLKSFGRSREDFLLYVLDLTQGRTDDVLFQRPKGSKRTQDGHRLSS